MAQSWKYAALLGLVGVATAAGCTVNEGDGDGFSGEGGEGGEGATGGTTGGTAGKGGSAGKGGTGGTAGKGGSAGSGGTAGTTAGTGGTTAGTGGDSGSGGEAGEADVIACDPDSGELDNTPYPDCEPADDDDECGACIQENCCEESKACYGYEPMNVCGWGGPDSMGEIDCYEDCMKAYVAGNDGLCDTDGQDSCLATCTTPGCGVNIGNQTQDLAVCVNSNCSNECLGADTCD